MYISRNADRSGIHKNMFFTRDYRLACLKAIGIGDSVRYKQRVAGCRNKKEWRSLKLVAIYRHFAQMQTEGGRMISVAWDDLWTTINKHSYNDVVEFAGYPG